MTSAHRHLTRSRCQLEMECPAKLPFAGKDRDANRICANTNLEDALPAAWGEKGFCSKNSGRQRGFIRQQLESVARRYAWSWRLPESQGRSSALSKNMSARILALFAATSQLPKHEYAKRRRNDLDARLGGQALRTEEHRRRLLLQLPGVAEPVLAH